MCYDLSKCFVSPGKRNFLRLAGDTHWAEVKDRVTAVARDYILERMVLVFGCSKDTTEAMLWKKFPTRPLYFYARPPRSDERAYKAIFFFVSNVF